MRRRRTRLLTRLLEFYGFARDLPVVASSAAAAQARAERPAGGAGAGQHRSARQPQTIGEPILGSAAVERLSSTSWTTQPRLYADGGAASNLAVRAASICGRRHARTGDTREDAFAIQLTSNGMIIVSVADGVGDRAARFSATGAHLASVLSCQLIGAQLEAGQSIDPDAVCEQVARQMPIEAKRFISAPYDSKSLATTLITAWISANGTYEGFMIGDGGVFTLTDGYVRPVVRGDGSTFSDTEALPFGYTKVERFAGHLAPGSAVLIATDGLAVPMLSPDVATALGETWRQPPSVLNFLYDLSFERRGEADDRTAAAVWVDPHESLS